MLVDGRWDPRLRRPEPACRAKEPPRWVARRGLLVGSLRVVTDPLNPTLQAVTERWPRILSTAQVAQLLAINPHTAWKLARDGRLPAFWLGNEYAFVRDQVLARLQATCTGQPSR